MAIEDKLTLVKELRTNTLKEIIDKHGKGIGHMSLMKLSIIDVKDILYEESRKIAKREMDIDNW